ncbi:hypothetical protein [Alicyclobacillus dauci]|uniref:Uncharacterized protein n=1 Tax=Alicyclobacillus dauci TaxID=1475485 RepID=A0ABY6Z5T6_9BACL|nr:hypothetical protein [Alicyclobacillus dauci]WAH38247.1 hypothetical protein NZD86_07130 [Alicyclobacillus dauci]
MIAGFNLNDLYTGGIAVAGIKVVEYSISKMKNKKLQALATELLPAAEHEAQTLLSSSAAKAVEAKLHIELNHTADQLKNSALAQWTQAALHGAGKAWNELSPAEQGAAIAFVQKHLPSSVEATEKEIAKAFQDAPQLAQMFAGDAAYVKAQELTVLLSKATDSADNGQSS